jgi:hypothetical protein
MSARNGARATDPSDWANLAKHGIDQLTELVKTGLKRTDAAPQGFGRRLPGQDRP